VYDYLFPFIFSKEKIISYYNIKFLNMDKISNNSVCVISVIALIAVIPRYIQLPKSLELLFHDTVGQLLLLLLAITVGSYNFTCGLLLVVLFLSIMLQSKYSSEGFIDYEEKEDTDMELNENFDSTKKKTKKTVAMKDQEEANTEDVEEEANTKDVEEEKPKPTKISRPSPTPNNSVVNDLKQELQASQKRIKALESKMKNALDSSNKDMESEMESEMQSEMQSEMKNEDESKMAMDMAMEMAMKTQATSEPNVEGFECGCTNDNRRTKFVKYQEAEGLIETFQNQLPQQTPQVKSESDCYDLAGCKYQNGYTPFNDTFYGPPVDSCHAYRKANVNTTGTLFYPLN
jgi:hypothetical protein